MSLTFRKRSESLVTLCQYAVRLMLASTQEQHLHNAHWYTQAKLARKHPLVA